MDKSQEQDQTLEEENIQQVQEETIQKNKKHSKEFLSGITVGVFLCTLVVCVVFLGKAIYDTAAHSAQTKALENIAQEAAPEEKVIDADTIKKLEKLENAIDTYYYGEEVSAQDQREGIYKGLVASLGDPYSEYYTAEELEDVQNSTQGISYGIGAYISLNKQMDMAMISGIIEDTPAQEAGLREGDIIYKVDDVSTQGMSLTRVVSYVKGREGTSVHLTIYREGEPDYLEMDVVRSKLIENVTVDYGMLRDTDSIGYLRIREFDDVTLDQYLEAMAELKGNGMKALVLDLRSNPGGNLTSVVDIARRILPEGMIVYTEDKAGNRREHTCDGTSELKMPIVVLVNEYSASASEILAGAIQDYNKGTILGTTTYGKGIVQNIFDLHDGTAMKLTISAYFTPSGRNIHGVGIKPDIELEYDYEAYEADGTDNQVNKAIEVLEGKIE